MDMDSQENTDQIGNTTVTAKEKERCIYLYNTISRPEWFGFQKEKCKNIEPWWNFVGKHRKKHRY